MTVKAPPQAWPVKNEVRVKGQRWLTSTLFERELLFHFELIDSQSDRELLYQQRTKSEKTLDKKESVTKAFHFYLRTWRDSLSSNSMMYLLRMVIWRFQDILLLDLSGCNYKSKPSTFRCCSIFLYRHILRLNSSVSGHSGSVKPSAACDLLSDEQLKWLSFKSKHV